MDGASFQARDTAMSNHDSDCGVAWPRVPSLLPTTRSEDEYFSELEFLRLCQE